MRSEIGDSTELGREFLDGRCDSVGVLQSGVVVHLAACHCISYLFSETCSEETMFSNLLSHERDVMRAGVAFLGVFAEHIKPPIITIHLFRCIVKRGVVEVAGMSP